MTPSIGIAGAGLAGRLLALEMAERGWTVSLFDRDDPEGTRSVTYAGAGMLAPACELEKAESAISHFGLLSLPIWKTLLERYGQGVYHAFHGSLVVAHPRDQQELEMLRRKVESRAPRSDVVQSVHAQKVAALEPELEGRFRNGLYFPAEAHIDNRAWLAALRRALLERGVTWHAQVEIERVEPHRLISATGETHSFDWAVDCRGLGAKNTLPDLRGVRGELIYLHAPEVHLRRPVRLMHPRYPIYVVPRAGQNYLVGATAIESEDMGQATVRSVLELLSAAYTVHPGFAEARVLETVAHCRPAFPDNKPRLICGDGILHINGLYRHGFLIAPALIQFARQYLEGKTLPPEAISIMKEYAA